MAHRHDQRTGVVYGAAAFGWWGVAPFYFKAVGQVTPTEILAHRIVWSLVSLVLLLGLQGRLGSTWTLARDRRTLLTMALTACLITVNWGIFIWSIAAERLVEASLGYFINPLVNILLGFVVLRERLRPLQWLAVALAATGVGWLTLGHGAVPWVALVLAGSFGLYGLLRKTAKPSGVPGLAIETALLLPLAAGYLLWLDDRGTLAFGHAGWGTLLLLLAAGPVTALPLVWFAEGARRLRYATIGFLQYLAPTGQLLVAVLAFGEPFGRDRAVAFGLIWAGLFLYSLDTVRSLRR
ncbi:MAG: EamA family transporter RarD [bacterium]|nr:EamA family transporter RarD [bacterium]